MGNSMFSKTASQLQVQLGGEHLSQWPAPTVHADGLGVVQVLEPFFFKAVVQGRDCAFGVD